MAGDSGVAVGSASAAMRERLLDGRGKHFLGPKKLRHAAKYAGPEEGVSGFPTGAIGGRKGGCLSAAAVGDAEHAAVEEDENEDNADAEEAGANDDCAEYGMEDAAAAAAALALAAAERSATGYGSHRHPARGHVSMSSSSHHRSASAKAVSSVLNAESARLADQVTERMNRAGPLRLPVHGGVDSQQRLRPLPHNSLELVSQMQLIEEFNLAGDGSASQHFRYRDYKRTLMDRSTREHWEYILSSEMHCLLAHRLPHKMSRRSFAYRLLLVVFHSVLIGGSEPAFWKRIDRRLIYSHLPDFAIDLLPEVALLAFSKYSYEHLPVEQAIAAAVKQYHASLPLSGGQEDALFSVSGCLSSASSSGSSISSSKLSLSSAFVAGSSRPKVRRLSGVLSRHASGEEQHQEEAEEEEAEEEDAEEEEEDDNDDGDVGDDEEEYVGVGAGSGTTAAIATTAAPIQPGKVPSTASAPSSTAAVAAAAVGSSSPDSHGTVSAFSRRGNRPMAASSTEVIAVGADAVSAADGCRSLSAKGAATHGLPPGED